MATTTNYSWTTPDDTALVKDGAAAIRTLGSSIDTSVKALSPGTTAGDIDYYTTSTAKARIGIGTAGQVLQVNSGATAPEWGNVSGEKAILIAQDSTQYIKYFTTGSLTTGLPATEDVTYYSPIYLPNFALDRISLRTGAGFSGTATVRLGLYNADATTGKPSTVYLDAGTVSCTAASTNYEITISNTPPAGYYYFAFNMQTAATTSNFTGFSQTLTPWSHCMPTSSTPEAVAYNRRYEETGVTGAFATAGSLTLATSQMFFTAVRIA